MSQQVADDCPPKLRNDNFNIEKIDSAIYAKTVESNNQVPSDCIEQPKPSCKSAGSRKSPTRLPRFSLGLPKHRQTEAQVAQSSGHLVPVGKCNTEPVEDPEDHQPILASLLKAIVSRVVKGVPGTKVDALRPVSERAEALLESVKKEGHRCPLYQDAAASLVVREVQVGLSGDALRAVGAAVGAAFFGTLGGLLGVAVGLTLQQCANLWTVARTVALIAAIYGHEVTTEEVQYDVVVCLCHSVFQAQRNQNTQTPQILEAEENASGINKMAKSWSRWAAQAVVSRMFGSYFWSSVPLTMAVQSLLGFSESNNAAGEVAKRAVDHFRPSTLIRPGQGGVTGGVGWIWGLGWMCQVTQSNPSTLKLYAIASCAFVPKVVPFTAQIQSNLFRFLSSNIPTLFFFPAFLAVSSNPTSSNTSSSFSSNTSSSSFFFRHALSSFTSENSTTSATSATSATSSVATSSATWIYSVIVFPFRFVPSSDLFSFLPAWRRKWMGFPAYGLGPFLTPPDWLGPLVLAWACWIAAIVMVAAALMACYYVLVKSYHPTLKKVPSLLPLLVLGGIPVGDVISAFSTASAACKAMVYGCHDAMGAAAAAGGGAICVWDSAEFGGTASFRVYFFHKAAVSLFGFVTRRMARKSHALDQLRTMLQGSLLTWSVWLAAAYLSSLTSGSSSWPQSGGAGVGAGPVMDAVSTVAMASLMDRLRSPQVLAHALGPGALVKGAAHMVGSLVPLVGWGDSGLRKETLAWMQSCCPPPLACGLVLALHRAWPLGALAALLLHGPHRLVVVPVSWPVALLIITNLMLVVMIKVWHEHGAALQTERRLLLILPQGSGLHSQIERALTRVQNAQSIASSTYQLWSEGPSRALTSVTSGLGYAGRVITAYSPTRLLSLDYWRGSGKSNVGRGSSSVGSDLTAHDRSRASEDSVGKELPSIPSDAALPSSPEGTEEGLRRSESLSSLTSVNGRLGRNERKIDTTEGEGTATALAGEAGSGGGRKEEKRRRPRGRQPSWTGWLYGGGTSHAGTAREGTSALNEGADPGTPSVLPSSPTPSDPGQPQSHGQSSIQGSNPTAAEGSGCGGREINGANGNTPEVEGGGGGEGGGTIIPRVYESAKPRFSWLRSFSDKISLQTSDHPSIQRETRSDPPIPKSSDPRVENASQSTATSFKEITTTTSDGPDQSAKDDVASANQNRAQSSRWTWFRTKSDAAADVTDPSQTSQTSVTHNDGDRIRDNENSKNISRESYSVQSNKNRSCLQSQSSSGGVADEHAADSLSTSRNSERAGWAGSDNEASKQGEKSSHPPESSFANVNNSSSSNNKPPAVRRGWFSRSSSSGSNPRPSQVEQSSSSRYQKSPVSESESGTNPEILVSATLGIDGEGKRIGNLSTVSDLAGRNERGEESDGREQFLETPVGVLRRTWWWGSFLTSQSSVETESVHGNGNDNGDINRTLSGAQTSRTVDGNGQEASDVVGNRTVVEDSAALPDRQLIKQGSNSTVGIDPGRRRGWLWGYYSDTNHAENLGEHSQESSQESNDSSKESTSGNSERHLQNRKVAGKNNEEDNRKNDANAAFSGKNDGSAATETEKGAAGKSSWFWGRSSASSSAGLTESTSASAPASTSASTSASESSPGSLGNPSEILGTSKSTANPTVSAVQGGWGLGRWRVRRLSNDTDKDNNKDKDEVVRSTSAFQTRSSSPTPPPPGCIPTLGTSGEQQQQQQQQARRTGGDVTPPAESVGPAGGYVGLAQLVHSPQMKSVSGFHLYHQRDGFQKTGEDSGGNGFKHERANESSSSSSSSAAGAGAGHSLPRLNPSWKMRTFDFKPSISAPSSHFEGSEIGIGGQTISKSGIRERRQSKEQEDVSISRSLPSDYYPTMEKHSSDGNAAGAFNPRAGVSRRPDESTETVGSESEYEGMEATTKRKSETSNFQRISSSEDLDLDLGIPKRSFSSRREEEVGNNGEEWKDETTVSGVSKMKRQRSMSLGIDQLPMEFLEQQDNDDARASPSSSSSTSSAARRRPPSLSVHIPGVSDQNSNSNSDTEQTLRHRDDVSLPVDDVPLPVVDVPLPTDDVSLRAADVSSFMSPTDELLLSPFSVCCRPLDLSASSPTTSGFHKSKDEDHTSNKVGQRMSLLGEALGGLLGIHSWAPPDSEETPRTHRTDKTDDDAKDTEESESDNATMASPRVTPLQDIEAKSPNLVLYDNMMFDIDPVSASASSSPRGQTEDVKDKASGDACDSFLNGRSCQTDANRQAFMHSMAALSNAPRSL